ncbi:hypothetical protein [Streptomyces lonarensis]|uniref:Uncharacterized protein n=1 Tax=Streptomyces lonarensis TaxID=700599 RepID=A0A7X6CZ50_9ACTN|nr:hypothetical protein [Streptomyces lonarensis]NJQ05208.1 hypothetical protein [Streptomyces lonarensis]
MPRTPSPRRALAVAASAGVLATLLQAAPAPAAPLELVVPRDVGLTVPAATGRTPSADRPNARS